MLSHELQEYYQLSLDQLENAFLQDYFTVIVMTSYRYYDLRKAEAVATEQEQAEYRSFLISIAHMLPFGKKFLSAVNSTCLEVMVTWISNETLFDLTTQKSTVESLTGLFNHICAYFNIMPITYEEMLARFRNRVENRLSHEAILQSDKQRLEDHKKMKELRDQLDKMKNRQTDTQDTWKVLAILFITLFALAILVNGMMYLRLRKKRQTIKQSEQYVDPIAKPNHPGNSGS